MNQTIDVLTDDERAEALAFIKRLNECEIDYSVVQTIILQSLEMIVAYAARRTQSTDLATLEAFMQDRQLLPGILYDGSSVSAHIYSPHLKEHYESVGIYLIPVTPFAHHYVH